MIIITLLICLFNPHPSKFVTYAERALLGISNITFYRTSTDYFADSADLNPFLHTWSLSVEEQFYFLFPFLIWFSGFANKNKNGVRNLNNGGNYKNLPNGVGESRKFNEAWTRYNSQKPSRTIDTGHRNHFHYEYNRVPTVRENARLQSFPDDFIFFWIKNIPKQTSG